MRLWHKINSAILGIICLMAATPALAVSLIRDAEIENTLRAYADPIFQQAGLNPRAIHIFIVDDPTINAFVAGGANMFIHTGLIMRTETPAMLLGVIAHETGHMAGGHLAQGAEKLKDAQLGTVLSMVLGAAVVAAGGGDAGMAVMSAGQEVSMRNYLHFSRANESAADQAGLNYLDALHITASGMLRVLEILRQNENRSYGNPDPYTRTHPLSIDRISHIRDHVMQSKLTDANVPAQFNERHARMLAKLVGFTKPLDETLSTYPLSDTSLAARYARSIAYYRNADLGKALAEIDALIKLRPTDPFFYELRGQFLFENNRIEESKESYGRAAHFLPNSPLILTDYAKVLLATGVREDLDKAVKLLENSARMDNSNVNTWHQMAIAYGKTDRQGMFYLASAEEMMLTDNMKQAGHFVDLALKYLEPGSSAARLRANDLKIQIEKNKKDKDYMRDTGQKELH